MEKNSMKDVITPCQRIRNIDQGALRPRNSSIAKMIFGTLLTAIIIINGVMTTWH